MHASRGRNAVQRLRKCIFLVLVHWNSTCALSGSGCALCSVLLVQTHPLESYAPPPRSLFSARPRAARVLFCWKQQALSDVDCVRQHQPTCVANRWMLVGTRAVHKSEVGGGDVVSDVDLILVMSRCVPGRVLRRKPVDAGRPFCIPHRIGPCTHMAPHDTGSPCVRG